MGTLNDWKRIVTGSFFGRMTLHKENVDGYEAVRLLVRDHKNRVWHLQEGVANGQPANWQVRRITGQATITDAHFWVRPRVAGETDIAIIGRSLNNRLYHALNGTRWVLLDNNAQFPADAITVDEEILGRGLNNRVWRGTASASTNNVTWQNLEGVIIGRPTALPFRDTVAVRGPDTQLYVYSAGSSIAHGGSLASDPIVVPLLTIHISDYLLAARGTDNKLWTRRFSVPWTTLGGGEHSIQWEGWQVMDQPFQGSPSFAPLAYRRIYGFLRGMNNRVLFCVHTDDQWLFVDWGGEIASDPVAVISGQGIGTDAPDAYTLRVFAIGTDGDLWEKSMEFSAEDLPELLAPPPTGESYNAKFVDDITYADTPTFAPAVAGGTSFIKVWRLRNNGRSAWTRPFRLVFIGGTQMSAPHSVEINLIVPAGGEADIAVQMVAPRQAGTYQGYWQMQTPGGTLFGDQIWVKIAVP